MAYNEAQKKATMKYQKEKLEHHFELKFLHKKDQPHHRRQL